MLPEAIRNSIAIQQGRKFGRFGRRRMNVRRRLLRDQSILHRARYANNPTLLEGLRKAGLPEE
jgi:hypothetical protein